MNKLQGTCFQKEVWDQIKSYKDIANAIGRPNAYRAVANACGKNPYPIVIPCHRVIASDGSIGGYTVNGGTKKKKKLLQQEGVLFV